MSFVSFSRVGRAEFRCQAEVRYHWIPAVVAEEGKAGAAIKATPTAVPEKAAAPAAGASPGKEVFWSVSNSSGPTEDEAKTRLKDMIIDQRSKADAACRDSHENQTRCFAAKYAQTSSTFQLMSFSQRKEFEKKIAADCQQAAGSCQGSVSTEPTCQEVKAAETPAPETGKGKDAKKK